VASDTRRAPDRQPFVEKMTIRGQSHWHHTFPYEPPWWTDHRQAARRRQVIADFDFGGIEILSADLRQMISAPLRLAGWPGPAASEEELAGLARRCLSLSWIATVAREHIQQHHDEMDGVECAIRTHETRSAELLANNAWNILLDLPKPLAIEAIREAVARPDELYKADPDD
jgi:hypothetical protein